MATAEHFAAMLQAQQDMQRGMMEIIGRISQQPSNMVDNRGIGKPPTFTGDETKYAEFMAKLTAFAKAANYECAEWMAWAETSLTAIGETEIENRYVMPMQGQVKNFSNKLFATLISCTEGDAFKLVNSVQNGVGLEALRLLKRRYEPRTPGTKRAILKNIINNAQAKRIIDVEANLMHVEGLMKKYENMARDNLPEDLKVTVIIDLCHKELKDHLELSTKDMEYREVREEIMNYVERKRENYNGPKPMDIGFMDDGGCQEHYGCEEHDQGEDLLGAIGKGGLVCHRCGGYGHFIRDCATPENKGKGKGKGNFNTNAKGDNGKGYGKGNTGFYGNFKGFNKGVNGKGFGKNGGKGPQCWKCGKFGHYQSECEVTTMSIGNMEVDGQKQDEIGGLWQAGCIDIDEKDGASIARVRDSRHGLRRRHAKVCTINFEGVNKFSALTDESESEGEIEIMAIDGGNSKDTTKITVDSGAAESVWPSSFVKSWELEVEKDGLGKGFIAANGHRMQDEGKKKVVFEKEGRKRAMDFRVTDVIKPLASVARIVEDGNLVVFMRSGGYIKNEKSGEIILLKLQDGTFVMEVDCVDQHFHRQARA
jgi:hypothetical protein